ncbi:hypothetical protein ACIPSE_03465 [Streptomyces sp. NPDC090106]|uniref:hypothetical protein n=1 Tax=Streptomyces sp. NPDC090106 TaxID=3365946 RepID=UPI0037FD83A6
MALRSTAQHCTTHHARTCVTARELFLVSIHVTHRGALTDTNVHATFTGRTALKDQNTDDDAHATLTGRDPHPDTGNRRRGSA